MQLVVRNDELQERVGQLRRARVWKMPRLRKVIVSIVVMMASTGLVSCSFGDDGPTTADRPDEQPTAEVLERTVSAVDPDGLPTPTAIPIVIEGTDPGNEYEVQPGDFMGLIAEKLGVSEEALAELNNIDDPNQLQVGQKLLIPEPEAASDDAAGSEDGEDSP